MQTKLEFAFGIYFTLQNSLILIDAVFSAYSCVSYEYAILYLM